MRGTLTLACGDNPAGNMMGGYKSLTSSFRKCRTCMATDTDIQTKVHTYVHADASISSIYSYIYYIDTYTWTATIQIGVLHHVIN